MSDLAHVYPNHANCKALRDYFSWHCDHGREEYRVELREHYPVIPPEGLTHDDHEKIVILCGVI